MARTNQSLPIASRCVHGINHDHECKWLAPSKMSIEIRFLRKHEKEVLIKCGKQCRFVLPCDCPRDEDCSRCTPQGVPGRERNARPRSTTVRIKPICSRNSNIASTGLPVENEPEPGHNPAPVLARSYHRLPSRDAAVLHGLFWCVSAG